MKILVVDIGGTNVKILTSGQAEPRKSPSGPKMTPQQMVSEVKELAGDWRYDVVSIGYPGLVHRGRIVAEPHNLAPQWVGFDFEAAFDCPVRLLNDAAMQALGSYRGGTLLFLGLGTGLGSALVAGGIVVPMELGHLSYKRRTYEDHLGNRGLKRLGKKKWAEHVAYAVGRLIDVLDPDDIVLDAHDYLTLDKNGMFAQQVVVFHDRSGERVLDRNHDGIDFTFTQSLKSIG